MFRSLHALGLKPVAPFAHRLRVISLASLSLATGLALALVGTTTAFGISGCRTDPTVSLSNGVSVQLWDSIATDISNVNGVAYVLHVPSGVSATKVTYDSTGYLERVQVVADQSGSHYSLTTNVSVKGSQAIAVTANAIRRDGTTATQNGTAAQAISLNWCT